MASLTGLAFQVDFLLGRGSRQNTVNGIRDTVDQINLVARQGATKASKERRQKLEEDLAGLQKLSEKSADRLSKGREAAGRSAATAAGKAAGAMTRKAKADTSGLDAVAKKTKSVANEMKSSFKSLNAELKSRGSAQLAGKSFTQQKTAVDFAKKEKAEREEIIAILQKEVDLARLSGKLTDGQVLNLQIAKDLNKDVNALHDQDLATQKELAATAGKYWKEFKENEKDEENHLRQSIALRQAAGQQIDNMATSVGQTLRNAFVYSTAAVAAFYYKLNDVLTTFRDFENELMNAQSIFQTTQDTLFGLSDQIAHFGLKYGVELQNATTGLYQLASAGLSATDSMAVLNDTLILSMAVQGDHNTISKLTTQTIFGFGMEMSDSTELVDKFAWAINKSLIEYQDLASAVKFAMPFFVSTGQSVDQLLGSLQVLTNRALEAGIAGRGLRQALAEFAESAEDNTRAFRKMGIEIVNSNGEFKQLTEIARDFHDTFGESASDVELMTTLLEDLNVRGATAFVHLVQNVDEFEGAVNDLQNSAGAAAEMAEIQNKSLNNQIQILKNALLAPFLITDEIGTANGYMNEFHMTLHQMVQTFSDMIYTTLPDGTQVLTELGQGMKDFVIEAFKQLTILVYNAAQIFKGLAGNVKTTIGLFNMVLVPLKIMLAVLNKLGPEGMQFVMVWKIMSGILPISTMRLNMETIAELQNMAAMNASTGARKAKLWAIVAELGARMTLYGAMGLMTLAVIAESKGQHDLATAYAMVGGAVMGAAIAYQALRAAQMGGPPAYLAAAAAGAIAGYAYIRLMRSMMSEMQGSVPPIEQFDIGGSAAEGTVMTADTGMVVPMTYDTGGAPTSNHRTVYVEPGETITSKSMNMLGGGVGGGITINIEGDVYDGDNFADKIAEALPDAIREGTRRGFIRA